MSNELRPNANTSINLIRYGKSEINANSVAGVNVRMVSGDHLETCRKVAFDAGIVDRDEKDDGDKVMTGLEFRKKLGDYYIDRDEDGKRVVKFEGEKRKGDKGVCPVMERVKDVIKKVKVIARASDEDKNLIVAVIDRAGGFIMMTGDGINDTEAL